MPFPLRQALSANPAVFHSYGLFRRPVQWTLRACAAGLALVLAFAPFQAQAQVALVVLGDSLSAGYQLPADAAFPAVLERALKAKGHKVEISNAAVSGDTSTGGLARLDWAIDAGTKAVILELGANDMLRGLDPAVTRAALDAILVRLKAKNIRVLLAGMLASPTLGADYGAKFNALYGDLAKKHGAILYPFFLDGVAADAKLNLADGMHPNRAGVERVVAGILPSVEALLKEVE